MSCAKELCGYGRLRKEDAKVDRGQEGFDQQIDVDIGRQFTAANGARQPRPHIGTVAIG